MQKRAQYTVPYEFADGRRPKPMNTLLVVVGANSNRPEGVHNDESTDELHSTPEMKQVDSSPKTRPNNLALQLHY